MARSNSRAGFNNTQDYTPSIKNKAVHVKRHSIGSLKSLASSESNRAGTVRPGRGNSFAPKSNRKSLGFKRGPAAMGGKK